MPKKTVKTYARSGAKRIGNAVGISSSGIKAGKLTTAGGLALLGVMPGYVNTGVSYSIVDVVLGKGVFATATMSYKMEVCLMIAGSLLLGRIPAGQTAATLPNGKLCGTLIAAGITMTIVGKWLNQLLGGSLIKL
jgi:hypothetical protein